MTGKQLRNSILQWAIQGKLIPQDPNDEPASVLLQRIREEKSRLVKEGKIKRDKNETIIYRGDDNSYYEKLSDGSVRCIDNEIPFDIPDSWVWVRLENICSYIQRGKSPKYSPIKKYPVIAQKCNQWSGFSIDKAQFIDPNTISSYAEERILQDNDLLWNSTGLGTLGRMAIFRMDLNPYELAVADSHVTVIRPMREFVFSEFLFSFFASDTVQSVIEDKAEGSTKQKELSTTTVRNYIVPVPPFSEQKRIIEKIDLISPLIDKYSVYHESFSKLNKLIYSNLKRSILQEAIQGKLVPQIESEGTAEELLTKIRTEKEQLVKDGKLKKSALANESRIFKGDDNKYFETRGLDVSEVTDDLPFDIPDQWSWVRLGDLFAHNTGKALKGNGSGSNLLDYLTTSNLYWDYFDFSNVKRMYFSDNELEKCTVRKGDLLVCEGGDIGRAAIWNYDYEICIQNHIHKLRPYSTNIQCRFFYFVLRYYKAVGLIGGKGIGIQGLSTKALHNIIVPLPPAEEQIRIVDRLDNVLANIMSR